MNARQRAPARLDHGLLDRARWTTGCAQLPSETLPPAEHTTVYITGEAWLCVTVRAHLIRQRGFRPSPSALCPTGKRVPTVRRSAP